MAKAAKRMTATTTRAPTTRTVETLETLKRVRLGDIDMAYDVAGPTNGAAAGRLPILLCMGIVLPGHAWRFVVPELKGERMVAWFDNRGTGGTTAPKGPYAMAQLARDAGALLDHLGWERAHLVGISMGGMVAQELALQRTARLASLTLMVTHPGGLASRLPPLKALPLIAQMALGSPARRTRAAVRLLFPAAFRAEIGDAWLERVLAKDFDPPITKHGRRGQIAAALGHDTRARLPQLGVLPTLIVKAGRDAMIAPRNSDLLHRLIPSSELVAFPEAGHGLIRQFPREIGTALSAHFARAEARLATSG